MSTRIDDMRSTEQVPPQHDLIFILGTAASLKFKIKVSSGWLHERGA